MAISIATITTFHIHVCFVTDRRQQGLPTDSQGTNTNFAWTASTPVLCHTVREKCARHKLFIILKDGPETAL
jgi:hypothetical protein